MDTVTYDDELQEEYVSRIRYVAEWAWYGATTVTRWAWRWAWWIVGECAAGARRITGSWWQTSLWWRGWGASIGYAVITGTLASAAVGVGLWRWPLPTLAVLLVVGLVCYVAGRTWQFEPDPADDPKNQLATAKVAEVEAKRAHIEARTAALLDRTGVLDDEDEAPRPPELPLPPWPGRHGAGAALAVNQETGGIVSYDFDQSVLVVGANGSGKSATYVATIVTGALLLGAEVHCLAFKVSRDFEQFRPALTSCCIGGDQNTLARAVEILDGVYTDLMHRQRNGYTSPTLIILDELAQGLRDRKHGPALADQVAKLAQLGRSGGVRIVIAAQRLAKGAIPKEIIDECTVRLICRVNNASAARTALDRDDATERDLHPERIAPSQKGRAVALGLDDADGAIVQGWMLPDHIVAEVVSRTRYADDLVDLDDDDPGLDDPMTVDGEVTEPTAGTDLYQPLALQAAPPSGRHRAAEPGATQGPPATGCAGPGCGNPAPDKPDALYCSRGCQQRAYRARKRA